MAINSLTASSDKIPLLSLCCLNSSKGSIIPSGLMKLNFATDNNVTSSINKSNKIRKNTDSKSPYLNSDKVHLLSRVTEKRVVQKKAADFVSSFPLAVKIYKANSDEFKSARQSNRRAKKSVLTLPNEQAPAPQTCTVSDMNDSEDFNHDENNRKKRPKKRPVGQNKRSRNDFEFYDRDARYCSQFNIHLDRSSTDVIKNFNGDGTKTLNRMKQPVMAKAKTDGKFNGHDVWRVLRNINRFQFRPSPPMSEESVIIPRKKENQMRYNRKDTRFIETCRTEEFAYISSIEVDTKSPTSFSHSSSFDRVTVIDKKDEFSSICEEFEKRLSKTQSNRNSKNQKFCRNKNKSIIKKTLRTSHKVPSSKQCDHNKNKRIDSKPSYEHSGPVSNYSSSVVNDVSIPLNALMDDEQKRSNVEDQQRKNSDHLTKPFQKDHQIPSSSELSGKENNPNSPANSVSSKTVVQSASKASDELHKICQDKICTQPMNGITKVVLSKGHDLVPSKRLETSKRKPRLATTLTNASIMPRMTQTDIRRRLLNMKFPLVILGKDQVSSTISVIDYEPPQFEGLDKHIWPFMTEWSKDYELKENVENMSQLRFDTKHSEEFNEQQKIYDCHGDYKLSKVPNKIVDIPINQSINKERKWVDSKLVLKKPVMPVLGINNKTQESKKQKPIRQLKDKMLKLLYKKPLTNTPSESNPPVTGQRDVNIGPSKDLMNEIDMLISLDNCLNNNDKLKTVVNASKTRQYLNPPNTRLVDTRSIVIKRPWAKAKWASDFIENVIKKIKNGVYYSQDGKHESGKTSVVAKEVSVQTKLIAEKLITRIACDATVEQASELALTSRNDRLKTIPGFDNSFSELEVQTLDTNKIEIKNCLANIIVQFDITVPKESDKLGIHAKKSCSLIPVEKNDSNMKLFKCKATILNAMLPAQLCAILPDMMRKIMHSDIESSHPLPFNKTDSQLSTISELSHFEGFDSNRTIPILFILSPNIRRILAGEFSHSIKHQRKLCKIQNVVFPTSELTSLLPIMPKKILVLHTTTPMEHILKNEECKNIYPPLQDITIAYALHDETCKKLQPYNYQNQSVVAQSQRINLVNLFENMWSTFKMFGNINLSNFIDKCTISIDLQNNESIETKVIIKIDKLKLDSIFENHIKISNDHYSQRAIDGYNGLRGNFSDPDTSFLENKTNKKLIQFHGRNHKIKRKGFVKLYKKCKSTSNIPNEKNNYPLSKITNIDDFFQLLGSKSLSCVFDGNSSKKILSSVVTMKNWISEINSRQAVLVLLLANKKDTPNLIRFRPVLLQGIAVNRITRASELDMEIEVIERENLNGFSQFDGISYLPASTENKDNLLEELNWIAKTTASDYQKPFDDSSEKLLKSLLEKRKQLNPSYLRVMARYVGLGLLRSPTKKTNLRC